MKKILLGLLILTILSIGNLYSETIHKINFMTRPVNLTITTPSLKPRVIKKTTVDRVKEAVTKLNGEEKKTQVYLIQRFLSDAKASVEMTIKVDGDVYNLNNGIQKKGDEPLDWSVILTTDAKVQTLSQYLDKT
jgi:selenophosphate synthase